jgi:hypothetical protein
MLTEEDAAVIDFPKEAGDGFSDAVDLSFGKPGHRNMQRFVNGDLEFPGGR